MKLSNKILKMFIATVLAFGLGVFNFAFAEAPTDAKLQYNQAMDYYNLGQYSLAAEHFKKATELDPNYIDAYFNLGTLLQHLQQDEEALSAFNQIIIRKPDDYEAAYNAAEISHHLGDFEKAKRYLSLIPQDSLIGQRARDLASLMETDFQTIKQEQLPPKTFSTANPTNNSNGVYSDIASPTGIVTDNEGNLYVAGFSDNTIYKITPDNKKIVYIKNQKIDGPIGMVMDTNGNIYVANYNKNNVIKIAKDGQVSDLITNIKNPYCMHITDNLLFVSSQGSNSVIRYKLED